jgi:beta-1,2-mannobiose phosphorylase / 1,2-beta-oligomannan phosphorylase
MTNLTLKDEGIILEASKHPFEEQAVLNPTCVEANGIRHMLYRAVRKNDMCSTVGYCQLADDYKTVTHRAEQPILVPEYEYEKRGIEDPRMIYLDGVYYIMYVAYDGENARVAYATSRDGLKTFKKHGLVSAQTTYQDAKSLFCANSSSANRLALYKSRYKFRLDPSAMLWEKDACLFTHKINGKFAMLTRILPGIQVIYFNDFSELTDELYWNHYLANLDQFEIMEPKYVFEHKHIGGGAPPFLTEDGWVMIYHAVEDTPQGNIYHACAALLDHDDPTKVIGRLDHPLFSPGAFWEQKGDVDNVVFPTGTLIKDDILYIYYGAADKLIAAKSIPLKNLLDTLKRCPT